MSNVPKLMSYTNFLLLDDLYSVVIVFLNIGCIFNRLSFVSLFVNFCANYNSA